MLHQRPGSQGASAAARIADVLSMAQTAVRKQHHRVAATPAPVLVRARGARAGPTYVGARGALSGRSATAAAGGMRGRHALSGKRAKSAGAARLQGTATSPFVAAGVFQLVTPAFCQNSLTLHR